MATAIMYDAGGGQGGYVSVEVVELGIPTEVLPSEGVFVGPIDNVRGIGASACEQKDDECQH
jgi:hypothetical protein